MKNILTNSLAKYSLICGLGIISLSYMYMHQIISTQPINKSQISRAQTIKQKEKSDIITLEKLQYHPTFSYRNTSPTFHFIPNKKNKSEKSKLLHEILNNNQKRKKFEYVLKKAAELNLPAELALIPVIESEYNTKATSHKGAGGIWQLMPGTARIFGVSSQQRFEIKPSTKAALLYFRDLYKKFGNWEFAIAAYNAGDAKVSKALYRNTHAKTIRDLRLPRETRNYVLSFYQLKKELKFSNVSTTMESKSAVIYS